jgi:hypothetical protein
MYSMMPGGCINTWNVATKTGGTDGGAEAGPLAARALALQCRLHLIPDFQSGATKGIHVGANSKYRP